jgi:serralysin
MLSDIAALQYMYGANYATNGGDSVYAWSPTTGALTIDGVAQGQSITNTIFMTIWDGGGTDTYDFTAYSADLDIDLQPGEWTTTAAAQLANLGLGEVARGNIANAWLYHDNPDSLIENAIGGSGSDMIVGNDADNVLEGGNGNDSLKGLGGDDTMVGGQGIDTCYFTVDSTACSVTYDATAQAYLVITTGGGTDTLTDVEFFAFTDKTVTAGVISPDSPILLEARPADGKTAVKDSANIVLTFSEDVFAGTGKVVIHKSTGAIFATFDVATHPAGLTISGNTVKINPAGHFDAGAAYYVTIDAGAFVDDEGKGFSGIADKGDLNFTVEHGIKRGTAQSERIGGTNDADKIFGAGGNDALMGKSGNDLLNGGSGADNMAGGRDDDTYLVNSTKDKVVEATGQGTDLVKSSISYVLQTNVEQLQLTGHADIDGSGNAHANTITGNAGDNALAGGARADTLSGGDGDDRLDGGKGRDVLTGGDGADEFVFRVKARSGNADTITDFDVASDTIVLAHRAYKALTQGTLSDADFAYATDGDADAAHVIYDGATGSLFYDRDGAGHAGDVKIATLAANLVFTLDDFLIV